MNDFECLSRCLSPIACRGFGHCRERNQPHKQCGRIEWLRYVRHADVPAYEADGWVFAADLGPTHGVWSVLMRWTGEGEPT